ncbi:MAG: serine/threonine-protein kinase [Xanthomonadales bacterium]|nr:serine/threonine-protein kinase [Xanthomonadales bacterium]
MEIPGYRILEEIGSGGFATIYLAEQLSLNRRVAVKLLQPRGKDPERWVERFLREVRIIAALDHPSIVSIYDFGKASNGQPYYTMPLLKHGDLNWLDWRTDEDLVECLAEICDALAHAHEQGIVHRDINPENILLNSQGKPLIADFGIAYSESDTERLTEEGQVIGNARYMSPEQARGEPVDPRADLYSLGIVIFKLLTNRLPFRGKTAVDTLLAQIEEPPPDLPEDCAHWQPLVHRCLAKDPEDRYASARELKEALEELVDPTLKTRTMPIPDEAAAKGKGSWSQWTAGLAVLAMLVGTIWVLWNPSSRNGSTEATGPASEEILLAAMTRPDGDGNIVSLTWTGVRGPIVAIERSRNGRGARYFNAPNNGNHEDRVEQSGWFGYRVCEEDRRRCSDLVTIEF